MKKSKTNTTNRSEHFEFSKQWIIAKLGILEKRLNCKLYYLADVIDEIVMHYKRDIGKYQAPNHIKHASLITFWIKKLKPISLHKETDIYINEIFALACSAAVLGTHYTAVGLDTNRFVELIHMLRYGFVSPRTLFLIFGLLYVPNNELSVFCLKIRRICEKHSQ